MSLVIAYFAVTFILQFLWNIDIGIPCIWKTFFHVRCPGCGLTRAAHHLIRFDFEGAFRKNPLIFLVAPALCFYFLQDFRKFKKQYSETEENALI